CAPARPSSGHPGPRPGHLARKCAPVRRLGGHSLPWIASVLSGNPTAGSFADGVLSSFFAGIALAEWAAGGAPMGHTRWPRRFLVALLAAALVPSLHAQPPGRGSSGHGATPTNLVSESLRARLVTTAPEQSVEVIV